MKKINKDFATDHLYRIFICGDKETRKYDHTISAFQDFLRQKGVEYSARMLYDYAEGATPFPADLLPCLIEFSKDKKLISFLLPSLQSATKDLFETYSLEEKDLQEKIAFIKRAKKEIEEEMKILQQGEDYAETK